MREGDKKDPGNQIQHRIGVEGTARVKGKACSRMVTVQRDLEFICSRLEHLEGSRRKMEQMYYLLCSAILSVVSLWKSEMVIPT